jgi:hypothetical protein
LPIIFSGPEQKDFSCSFTLRDQWGISAGYVLAQWKVEYDPDHDHLVKLVPRYYPDTGRWALFRWHAVPNTSGIIDSELNYLWQNPNPDPSWKGGTGGLVGSAWEAVTHYGGSQAYTLQVHYFGKDHYSGYICNQFPH